MIIRPYQESINDSRFIRSSYYLNQRHNQTLPETPLDPEKDPILDKELYSFSKTEYKRLLAECLSLQPPPDFWVPLWSVHHRLKSSIKDPHTVLDLPNIRTNFCSSLMDWSKTNLLTMGFPRNVYLWHPPSNTTLSRLVTNTTCVKWNPSGTQLFAASGNMAAFKMFSCEGQVLSMGCGKCHVNCYFTCCDFSSLAPLAVIGCVKGGISVYYVNKDLNIIQRTQAFKDSVTSISFSCDGTMYAAVSKNGGLAVYSTFNFQKEFYTDLGAPSRTVAWHPWQRSCLVTATSFGQVTLFNTFTGKTEAFYSSSTSSKITGLTFNPLSAELVISFKIFEDFQSGRTLEENVRHQINIIASFDRVVDRIDDVGPIDYLCWSPNSNQLATAGSDETCRIWDFLPLQKLTHLKKEDRYRKKLTHASACMELNSALGFSLR